MKTLTNLIFAIIFIIIVVVLSGGSFRTLKKNTNKVTETTVETLETGVDKFNGNN